MNISGTFLKKLDRLDPDLKDVMLSFMMEMQDADQEISVNKKDIYDLKDSVRELVKAQTKTELKVRELAEAQKKTEKRVEELAKAQQKTEKRLEELAGKVELLTEAQKRTEKKLEELAGKVELLAEAQKRTEKKVEELAEAQKKTEEKVEKLTEGLNNLTQEVRDLSKQVGGISMDIGYGIEDRIMPYMYDFGRKEFGIEVRSVDRRNVVYPDGNYDEVNIYAEGSKSGKPSFLIGECKAHPGKKDIDKFTRIADRLKKTVKGEIFLFFVGYQFTPDVETYIRNQYPSVRMYKTYEFELKYKRTKIDSSHEQ